MDPWGGRRDLSESQYRSDPGRFEGEESGFARWIAPRLAASTGARLVEIGCGPGRDLCHYARQGLAVLGIDHAPSAVEGARQRAGLLSQPARSRARVVQGEADNPKMLAFGDVVLNLAHSAGELASGVG